MSVRCVIYPARGGIAPRLMFVAKTRNRLRSIARDLNNRPDPAGRLRHAPGLKDLLYVESGIVRVRRDTLPHLYPVTLHQKMAVFDNAVTYIGGLDLNERRIDDPTHDQPAQDTWHDLQIVTHDPRTAAKATQCLNNLPDVIDRKRLV
jgi:phosphatidylserine/phosphatidylglycerophosphate/cardiolipin synthase-like enzyme